MLDYNNVRDAIADAVEQATGLLVIFANQNAPIPAEPYATVFVTPSLKTGYDRVTYADNTIDPDLTEMVEGTRQVSASINFYKDNAFINASDFIAQLQSTSMIQFFKSRGLGFGGVSDIRDITEIDKQLWQERAQLDLTVYALSNFSATVTSIESVTVQGEAHAGDDKIPVNININVNEA